MDLYGESSFPDCSDDWKNVSLHTNGDTSDIEASSILRKKLASLEYEKYDEQRSLREKISDLQGQIVRLRNEGEKGETVRQRLEYELARSQKDMKNRMKEAAAREKENDEVRARLQDQIRDLEVRSEEHRAQHSQAMAAQKERVEELEGRLQRMRTVLEEKMNETRELADEKCRVSTEVEILEGKLDELRMKFVGMSEQCQALRAEMTERSSELGACRNRELVTRKELDASLARVRQCEEEAEREKAAQLEQRYNADLIQLRLRETESLLQSERTSKQEAMQLMEELSQKLKDMEQAWEEEKKMTTGYRKDFERLREEHMASRACLTDELAEKRSALENLRSVSRRLEDELDGVKKEMLQSRNQYEELEDRHRRLHNELLGLAEKATPANDSPGSGSPPRLKNLDGHGLVEQLRSLLSGQRRRVASANEEVAKLKIQCESAIREARVLRDQNSSKEKALQSTTATATTAAQEVKSLKRKLVDVERRVSELRAANSEQKRRLEKALEEAADRKEELQRTRKGRRCEQEERVHFLADLNRKLSAFEPMSVAGAVASKSRSTTEPDTLVGRDATWSQLKGSVSDQLEVLLGSLDRQKDKIHHLEETMRGKEKFIDDLRRSNEAQLSKYEALNQTFSRQKKETEEHYNKLLQDMQAKSKQSQALVDQAWERIHASGNLQVGLESECATLRSAASRFEAKNSSLLAALALLVSLHVPLARRAQQLATERRLMTRLVSESFASRRRLHDLALILNRHPRKVGDLHEDENEEEEPDANEDEAFRRSLAGGLVGLARFRVAVVAVLAANRLRRLGFGREGHHEALLLPRASGDAPGGLVGWLQSSALRTAVEESMAVLEQQLVDRMRQEGDSETATPHGHRNTAAPSSSSICSNAVRCLGALLDRLESDFFPSDVEMTLTYSAGGRRLRRSHLSTGLLARQAGTADSLAARISCLPTPATSLPDTVSEVEQGVLTLSRRLMAADSLASQLRDDNEGLQERLLASERRTGSVQALRRALEEMVPAETHRRVQADLERCRASEAEAHDMLRAQANQMTTLAARVDQLSANGTSRDNEMREAADMLSRSRVEMKRREQNLRDLSRQVLQLEQEKNVLYEKMTHADSNLTQWRFERDLCLSYLTAILEIVAESAKANRPLPADVRVVLEAESSIAKAPNGSDATDADGHVISMAVSGEPAQLIACRNVVRALAESGARWQRKVVTADEKVAHYRRHVEVLKRELAAACARAVDCPEGLLSAGESSSITPPAAPTVIRISPASSHQRILGSAPGQSEC